MPWYVRHPSLSRAKLDQQTSKLSLPEAVRSIEKLDARLSVEAGGHVRGISNNFASLFVVSDAIKSSWPTAPCAVPVAAASEIAARIFE